ncbi:MAG: hypothetical protein IPP36_06895 [Nitrosomonadales bacterium]|nr:hypothetical protein [Nitrosomonadales bacterium]
MNKIEGLQNIASAGVCKDEYVIAQINNTKPSRTADNIIYREIGSKAKKKEFGLKKLSLVDF